MKLCLCIIVKNVVIDIAIIIIIFCVVFITVVLYIGYSFLYDVSSWQSGLLFVIF